MRGEVEIWKGEDLILKEPNMLVDGAGELLADIMTVSRSLSGVEDHATSSILDASNYRVNAISFGTGPEAFTKNGHDYNTDGSTLYANDYLLNVANGTTGNVTLMPVEDNTSQKIPSDPGLPEAPTPEKTLLQEGCDVPGEWTGSVVGKFDFSAIFPANGQLQNFIPSAIVNGYIEQNYPVIAADPLKDFLWTGAGAILGCFPDGSSAPHTTANRLVFYERPGGSKSIKRTSLGGFFNEVSSMDSGGFVNMVMSSVPNPGLDFSGGASGLCLSAEAPANDYEGFPFVEYTVSLSRDDCIFANAYGGITDLGLWSIDMEKSLQAGNSPPFEFAVVNNPRKYKLFCRKGFSTNIVDADPPTLGLYRELTIKWRIYFR